MNCSIIAAYAKNRVIGKGGRIPWQLPSERKRFKELCRNKKIIMGRKSFEEIGHALSYCTIIILSKTLKTAPKGCLLAASLEQAFAMCGDSPIIAGGEQLYRQALPYAVKIYATEIQAEYDGDTFFPEIDETLFEKTEEILINDTIPYKYITYTKKS